MKVTGFVLTHGGEEGTFVAGDPTENYDGDDSRLLLWVVSTRPSGGLWLSEQARSRGENNCSTSYPRRRKDAPKGV